jgi:uncharacterized protein involved in outer membrane biogenesis
LPRIDHLEVADGHLLLDDKMLDTQLRVDMRGREGGAQAPTESGYRATIAGRYRAAPLQLALRSGGALPLLRNEEGDGDPVATSLRMEGEFAGARVLFDGQAAALMGARHLDGAVRFGGPSLALVGDALGLTLPQTPPFDLRGRVAHHDGVWTLRIERAAVGRSELAGEFRYDTAAKPPRLSGRASGPQLMLADLGPSIGAPTAGSAPRAATAARTPRAAAAASSPKAAAAKAPRVAAAASAPAGGVLPQTHFDLPSLRAMDADVHVAIDQLVFPTSAMTPLRNLRTRVLLDGGVLELRELRAQVAGGQLSGSTRLDGSKPPARWVARLRFGDVDVAGWLRGLRTAEGERKAPSPDDARALREQRAQARRDTEAKPPALLTGRLEASVDVTGAGQSTAEILSTLEGPIEVIVRDGTMSHLVTEAMGIDLAQALGVAVKGDAALPLACARFDFVTHQGVMRLTRGVLDNRDSTIRVAGQIDLRTEQLALAARARPKDVSPISLRAPVTVSGTLQDPSVRIEPSLVAARALGALALGALAGPLAAVIPLIDPGEREQGEPCTAGSGADASAQAAQAAASSSEQRVPR